MRISDWGSYVCASDLDGVSERFRHADVRRVFVWRINIAAVKVDHERAMYAGNDRTVGRYLGRCAIDRDALYDGTNRFEIALPRPVYVGNDVPFRGDRDDVRKIGEIIIDPTDIKRAEHAQPHQTVKGDEGAIIAGSQIIDRRQIAVEQPKIQQCRRAFTPNTNPFAADQLLQDNGIVRRNSDIDQARKSTRLNSSH